METSGANLEALLANMDAALLEFTAPFERDAALWTRGPRNKWTAGQHADHIAAGLRVTADSLEANEPRLRGGTLAYRPGRGPLQALFISVAVKAGKFPRGGRAPRIIQPSARPDREVVLALIRNGAERHHWLAERLTAAESDRLWIPNPFLPRWHYTLPEVVRLHAVHAQHHSKLVAEIAAKIS